MLPNLRKWIAGAESWHTYKDFDLKTQAANYPFLARPDDFYINLAGLAYDILDKTALTEGDRDDLFVIARSMELFSLAHTRGSFTGINVTQNALIAAGLYRIAGYPASSAFLLGSFVATDFPDEITDLLFRLLRNSLAGLNTDAHRELVRFVNDGDATSLASLRASLGEKLAIAEAREPQQYLLVKLCVELLKKFEEDSVWTVLRGSGVLTDEQIAKFVKGNLLNRTVPVWSFFPSQIQAIREGILTPSGTYSLQMPTSAGKTALAELIVYCEAVRENGAKAVFLAPYRSLATELKDQFSSRLRKVGLKVEVLYGDDLLNARRLGRISECDLIISTPEKFSALSSRLPGLIDDLSLVICDEGHLLDEEGSRGLHYELLLARIKAKGGIGIIYLSAIVPNIRDVNAWLGGTDETLVKSSYRPTPIDFGFLKEEVRNAFSLTMNPLEQLPKKYILNNFVTDADLIPLNTNRSRPRNGWSKSSVSVAAAIKSTASGPTALFAPSILDKKGILVLAERTLFQLERHDLDIKGRNDVSRARARDIQNYLSAVFGPGYLLTKLSVYGVGYHCGLLPQFVREILEDAVRQNVLRLIICTKTLAEGVNLPIRTLVIHMLWTGYDDTRESLRIRDIKNIVGRAGRAGKEVKGTIISTNPADQGVLSRVIRDTGAEPVLGYLFRIVELLSGANANEALDAALLVEMIPPETKDVLDLAILNMLPESASIEDLGTAVDGLVEHSFAFTQCSEQQKVVLTQLFNSRKEKIAESITRGELPSVKKAGVSPENFTKIASILNIGDERWLNIGDDFGSTTLDFLKQHLDQLDSWRHAIDGLVQRVDWLSEPLFWSIISGWLKGKTYPQIAEAIQGSDGAVTVDQVLRILSHTAIHKLKTYIDAFIDTAAQLLENSDRIISQDLTLFSTAITYGLPSAVHVHLANIGFSERTGNLALGNLIKSEHPEMTDENSIAVTLAFDEGGIVERIRNKLPTIAVDRVKHGIAVLRDEYLG